MIGTNRLTSAKGSERGLWYSKAVALLLAIIFFFNALNVTTYAATVNYPIRMDSAEQVGTITYKEASYPLFNVRVNLQEYDAISIVKESGTITVNGAETNYPTGIQANNSGTIGLSPDTEILYSQDDIYFKTAKECYQDNKESITLADGKSISENGTCLLFRLQVGSGRRKTNCAFLAVSWENFDQVEYDTKRLAELLVSVSDEEASNNYYTSNDRYDGKNYSANGFWAEFTKKNGVRDQAQKVLDNPVNQKGIDSAVTDLEVAISKLLPSTRANTTLLYEELLNTLSKDDYTPKTWATYSSLRSEAEEMMASMFDQDGNPTEANTSDKQSDLDKLAGDLKTARSNLDQRAGETGKLQAEFCHAAIQYLAEKFDPDKLSGYTEESLSTLRTARETALEAAETSPAYTTIGQKELNKLLNAMIVFQRSCYQLVSSDTEQISVRFSAVDATGAYVGSKQNAANTQELTLDANTTVGAVLDQFGISTSLVNNSNNPLLFVNGDLYFSHSGYLGTYYRNIILHDGDELTVVHFRPKMETYSSGAGQYPALMEDVGDWFHYSVISAPETVTAGQPFTLTLTADGALPQNRTGTASPVSGAAVYTSGAFADKADAATADVLTPTYVSTGADGTAQLTLYAEGWTAVNAFRLDDEGRYTVGPTVLVYVNASDDLSAIKTQLRKELDGVYYDDNYPESCFTSENWTKLTEAYHTGISGIEAAETSGAAREAEMTALQTIKQMQQEADSSNRGNLETFRQYLNRLPDDADKLDESSRDAVERLISAYEKMTEYQRGELTAREQAKYDAIAAAYAEGLAPAASYSLSFEQKYVGIPEEDQETLEQMIAYLQANTPTDDKYGDITGNKQLQPLFSFSKDGQITEASPLTYNIKACVSPDYIAYLLCRDAALEDGNHKGPGVISGDGWSISDEEVGVSFEQMGNVATMTGSMIYTVNGTRYAIRGISVEGTTVPLSNSNSSTWQYRVGSLIDATDYKGKTDIHINYRVPNALVDFHMPYNDVKITVTWGPASGTEDEVQAARDSAQAVLEAAYQQYDSESDNYAAITAAYQTGVDAVNTAKTVAAVTEARTTALQAMKTAAGTSTIGTPIEGWGSDDTFDAGPQVGTVTVSFENTTYDDGYFYDPQNPFLYQESYPLGANDSMMTVALRALVDQFPSATWSGTGNDFGLTYLAGITVDGHSLDAFDGGNESGWMGTLNDWFTNEGFNAFTVENGKLGDGDYIRIMYTTTGYGEDLGGTWYNSDTTLNSLEVEGGTLLSEFTPGESGGSYDYTLLISGNSANVKLTPTATNKNFLTKIFLNEKVTSNTEGGSFYKRTQYIPVTTGDTIYVGCGVRAWPSMNNQEGNTQENDGTWYALHVVNADDGSAYVVSLIDLLPDTIHYENYTTTRSSIDAAEAAYDALSEMAKANVTNEAKLEQLKAEIESFEQIDAFKEQLAALPNAKRITLDNQEAIEQAKAAYDALTAEQKEYLTHSEEEKMQALVTRLAELREEAEKDGYIVSVADGTSAVIGETVTASIQVSNKEETTYNSYAFTVSYDAEKLTYTGINTDASVKDENGILTIVGYGVDKTCGRDNLVLTFTGKAVGAANVTITKANIDKAENANAQDAPEAALAEAGTTITVTGYPVSLSEDFTGDSTVDPGADYTFVAKDIHYDYDIVAKMGGEDAEVVDKGDGSYTIKNVTGNLVITDTKTPKTYTVTVEGAGQEDVAAATSATYLSDYSFQLTKDDKYTYDVAVTVDGEAYTPTLSEDGSTYTIAGADVTGAIVITVHKEAKPVTTTEINFEGSGSGDVKGGTTQTADNGVDFTFELKADTGYHYTVTLDSEELTADASGKYTISGAKLTGERITVRVEKTPKSDVKVEVYEYIKLNSKTMWLVTAAGTVSEGKILSYDGNAMFWSDKYDAYCYLVVSTQTQTELKAEATSKVAEASADKVSLAYDGDVNKTGLVDINDAQLTYNMYNALYESFDQVSMQKFLEADVNGDKTVTTLDAAAIIGSLLGA